MHDPADIERFAPKAIILSGGPESVYEAKGPQAPQQVFAMGVPVLGICYGMQTMAAQLGGQVESSHASRIRRCAGAPDRRLAAARRARGQSRRGGPAGARCLDESRRPRRRGAARIQGDRGERQCAARGHGGRSAAILRPAIPSGSHAYLAGRRDPAPLRARDRRLRARAGRPGNIIEDSVARIRAQVGTDKVLLGLSGGVDSSVLAALLHRAIGAQLTCVFVDHGLLRLGEGDQVMATFAEHMGVRVIRVECRAALPRRSCAG